MSSTGRPPAHAGMSSAKGTAKKKGDKRKEAKEKNYADKLLLFRSIVLNNNKKWKELLYISSDCL